MKKLALLNTFWLLTHFFLNAQNNYRYRADLKNISDDKISIELQPPAIKEAEAIFSFAKVIPGSYSIKDFGKYVDDLKALDKKGKQLKVKRLNKNQFLLQNINNVRLITYKVRDTWDQPEKDFIFQPGGSNIESGSNIIMNNHAFFGYFEGYNQLPFEITVQKPDSLYASTHLPVARKDAEKDVLTAQNYVYLADNPVFYCKPDTNSFTVGKSQINISVFSATGKVNSTQVASYLRPMANALQQFFGNLPVDSYQFLFYFENQEKALTNKDKGGGGFGALEHNYSSLYFLPELAYEPDLKSMVNDVSSHEFLHILTPLNLHSEEIEYFNFTDPKMSKQLWLYEGVTEYFSNLVQWQAGIFSEKVFFKNMQSKINEAHEFGDFSMTEMSEKVLEPGFQKKYSSVYNRGALIAFLVDIFIREKTNNQKDLKKVLVSMAAKYGPGKPFKDGNFLNEFVQSSHPDVKNFIDSYIIGGSGIDFNEFFNKIGYEYRREKRINVFYPGNMSLKFNDKENAIAFTDVQEENALGVQNDDILLSVDGVVVNGDSLEEIWLESFRQNTTRPTLTIKIKRNGKEQVLTKRLFTGYLEVKNYVGPLEEVTKSQQNMLGWFKK